LNQYVAVLLFPYRNECATHYSATQELEPVGSCPSGGVKEFGRGAPPAELVSATA